MKYKGMIGAALACALTFVASAEIRTDFNHHADFAKYHTFSIGKINTSNPLDASRIKRVVTRDLEMRGLQLVPTGGDLVVFAKDKVKTEHEMETMYNGMGGGWGDGWAWGDDWGDGFGGGMGGFGEMGGMGGMTTATTTEVDQRTGKFVLDLFEGSSKKLLFRGVADQDISNKSSKEKKTLDKDADDMLKKLPLKPMKHDKMKM